ncbi:twin-arginine translocation signal domain-containing protein [Halovivax cerinus]|uniref:Twin-arginine translocation signal domain-containing protein n=1 Tax=Halovivax cerinus TaxID=1487865 RepID=A0ABD5NSY0_9EURY|nr:twin-arginine translocation signal domain-containing protein [Halovivax cerinus]
MTGDRTLRPTRRDFLAAASVGGAGTSLAGCLDRLPWRERTSNGRVPANSVDAVLSADGPSIEWPDPIEPSSASIADAHDRVDELLAQIPDPITVADVPNGVVRESIASNRRDAIDGRDASDVARYRHLRETSDARGAARHSRTTYDAIELDHESLVADLRTERTDVLGTVRTQLDAIDYRGPETVEGTLRAALVARQREADLRRAERTLGDWRAGLGDTVIDLGEAAGDVERASATASIWSHLIDRYEAGQSDVVPLESSFSDVIDRSLERIETVDFPEQVGDTWYGAVGVDDLDDRGLEFALWRAGGEVIDAADGVETASVEGRLGTALYRALEFEVRYRAFETFRDWVRSGSFAWPASVSEIEAERSAALLAAETARESVTGPTLGALRCAERLQSLEWTDAAVRRAADNDPETRVSLDDEYRDYALRRAELTALPDAVETFRDRLRTD